MNDTLLGRIPPKIDYQNLEFEFKIIKRQEQADNRINQMPVKEWKAIVQTKLKSIIEHFVPPSQFSHETNRALVCPSVWFKPKEENKHFEMAPSLNHFQLLFHHSFQ